MASWDYKAEKLKGRGREAEALNDYIDDVRFRIKESKKELEAGRYEVTPESVRDHFKNEHISQKPPSSGHTLKELLKFHDKIEGEGGKQKEGQQKEGQATIPMEAEGITPIEVGRKKAKLKKGTLKNYVTTEKYLDNFMQFKYGKKDIDLMEFDYQQPLNWKVTYVTTL